MTASPPPSYPPGPLPPEPLPPGPLPPGYAYAPPALSPAGQPLADFGLRLVARLIDGAILGAISLVIIVPIYIVMIVAVFDQVRITSNPHSDTVGTNSDLDLAVVASAFGLFILIFALAFVLSYVYSVELMFRSGQTPGKRIMKIKIVPLDPGQPLTRGLAAKRYLVEVGCGFVPGLSLLDGLWQLWDKPYQQCLHDKWPATTVIKLNP